MSITSDISHSKLEVKKSKFLGFCFVVQTETEVKEKIAELKKEYQDAKHIAWAYRLKQDGVLKEKYTDDKEPSGSAGSAILFLLQKKEELDYLVVVIRYFGGTKLGVGGLARAYTESAKLILKDFE